MLPVKNQSRKRPQHRTSYAHKRRKTVRTQDTEDSPHSDDEGEDGKGKPKKLEKVLMAYTRNRFQISDSDFNSHFSFRRLTRTVGENSVLRRQDSMNGCVVPRLALRQRQLHDSRLYGSLRHLYSVLMNYVLEKMLDAIPTRLKRISTIKFLTQPKMTRRIMQRMVEVAWPEPDDIPLAMLPSYGIIVGCVDDYLARFPTPRDIVAEYQSCTKGVFSVVLQEIKVCYRKYAKENWLLRTRRLLFMQLKAMNWRGYLKKGVETILNALDTENVDILTNVFSDAQSLATVQQHTYNSYVEVLGRCFSRSNTKFEERLHRLWFVRKKTYEFLCSNHNPMEYGDRLFKLLPVFQNKCIFVQYDAKSLTELHKSVYDACPANELRFNVKSQKKPTTKDLTRNGMLAKTDGINWHTRCYDFYGAFNSAGVLSSMHFERRSNKAAAMVKVQDRRDATRTKKERARERKDGPKVLCRHIGPKRNGLHELYPHMWTVTSPDLERGFDENELFPVFVESVRTDSLQVKVGLVTVTLKDPNFDPRKLQGRQPVHDQVIHDSAAAIMAKSNVKTPEIHHSNKRHEPATSVIKRGVAVGHCGIRKRGYSHITAKLDIARHKRGIFRSIKPVEEGQDYDVLMISQDPGQIKIGAHTENRMTSEEDADEQMAYYWKRSAEKTCWYTERDDYHRETLMRTDKHIEEHRRRVNKDYANACAELAECSLKIPGACEEYVHAVYNNMGVMRRELCCYQRIRRRFARFRAHQRGMHNMAKRIVYHSDLRTVRQYRGKEKREMRRHLKNRSALRIVAFEDGQFSHGKVGPVPRIELIIALSRICPVVLIDKHKTSKACHVCEGRTEYAGGRYLYCPHCNIKLERDTNATLNIGKCAALQLHGRERPEGLRHSNSNSEHNNNNK